MCALITVISILATWPFLNMGVNDDFSYAQIALRVAETGKLIYNGWNTPMIGAQAYWAALFIKVFGFSFDVVRLSTLPFVAGCALLFYYLALRASASSVIASVATCFVMLSPLAIPLEASFMTDIPALFFVLLCFVATLRALDELAKSSRWLWVLLLTSAGILGGTVRQVGWLAPIFLLPLIAMRLKSVAPRMIVATLWVLTVATVYKLSAWFSAQPYSVALSLIPSPRARVHAIALNLAGLYLEGSILLMPLLSLYALHFLRLTARARVGIVAVSIGVPMAMLAFSLAHPPANLVAFDYFAGNVITKFGILGANIEAIGQKPILIPLPLQVFVLILALAAQFVAIAALLSRFKLTVLRFAEVPTAATFTLLNANTSSVALAQILLVFTIPYLGTVLSRAIVGLAIDRYLLPVLAFSALLLLGVRLTNFYPSLRLAITFVAIFALYGMATTHDYFSCSRARLTAARELLDRKIADTQITAGLEFDGWTQIKRSGYINDSRIIIPARAFASQDGRKYPLAEPYWFWSFTPVLQPEYFVVLSPQSELTAFNIPPVAYSTWLPPFRRQVFVQVPKSTLSLDRH
jgi:hypothetical protein